MANDELLTRKEAVALTRSSIATLCRWVKLGRVQPLRTPSNKPLFKRSDLLREMERQHFEERTPPHDPSMG